MYLAYSYTYNVGPLQRWKIYAVQLFTVFSYTNSAINPVIYGFTNDFFRKSFRNVFGCLQPSARRSGNVPSQNGTIPARRRSTQCRPSGRRRMTTLSGRPDLVDAVSQVVQHPSAVSCPAIAITNCGDKQVSELTPLQLMREATVSLPAKSSAGLEDHEMDTSTFTVDVHRVHVN